ncbi:alpha/beta fold hydrolase [Peredibacter sp. HCB2-198]|uniref:alpha/beta fold hydrolase n=1 Tax=Peredibacter sp. HCB2-198 TaxID=3383025 RepID=UPI0038B44336
MDKSKPTLLFLHGALGTAQDMEPLMGLLREKGYTTHSFSFSGHGLSAAEPAEFRIDLFARDLDKFLKDNQLKNPVIFGYSMGGYVALYHKANFEDSPIARIFTYGTKFNWSEKAVSKELPMMNPDHLLEKFPNFAESLKQKHGERWKQLLRSTAHMMQNLERLDGLTREDMSEIDIPVILILGDQDRMVTSEETHLTSSWLHHSQTKTISHSKHELERSNLKEIADLILDNLH